MSVDVNPEKPGFEEARWIQSEDVNIEHLLDVFTFISPGGDAIWDACFYFMRHLFWHKPRKTILGSKIEALPDDHPHKPKCLFELSRLFERVGNDTQEKRLLTHTLEIWKRRGNDFQVAATLLRLCDTNRVQHLYEEGIR